MISTKANKNASMKINGELWIGWNWAWNGKTTCLNKLLILLIIFSGFQTKGLSMRDSSRGGTILATVSPYLEPIKYNTTVFIGQTAYLPCIVKHLGEGKVSWIRKRDLHIITSGTETYTNDKRFSLLRDGKFLNAFTLKISSVRKEDEGSYECQVNTEPKLTETLHLIVFGSPEEDSGSAAMALGMLDSPYHQKDDHRSNGYEAKILGQSLIELEVGQVANFTCIISHRGPPPNITWFKNSIPIRKEGFSVDTEKSSYITTSQLVILKVGKGDEGKYSCGGVTVYPDSVVLKIRSHHSHSHNSRWKDEFNSSFRVENSPTFLLPIIFISLLRLITICYAAL